MPYHILNNIRVIDASTGIAGPYAGKMLADCGAEVIKLELPDAPDFSRGVGASFGGWLAASREERALFASERGEEGGYA